MEDRRTHTNIPEGAPVFSVYEDGAKPPENKTIWTKGIQTENEADKFRKEFTEQIKPWIEMSDAMMNQINYAMLTISALNKNKSDKSSDMLERIKPIIALKEVMDVRITQQATDLLNKLEKGELG